MSSTFCRLRSGQIFNTREMSHLSVMWSNVKQKGNATATQKTPVLLERKVDQERTAWMVLLDSQERLANLVNPESCLRFK